MSWCDVAKTGLGLAFAVSLTACGFTPVYGPDGSGNQILNQVAFSAPDTVNEFTYTKELEQRMGRSTGPYQLDSVLSVKSQDLGSTSSGETTRVRLNGSVDYTLKSLSDDQVVLTGHTFAFTSYSFTGSTAATQAAERDANERLMIILADQVIDGLLLQANTLPEAP